MPRVDTEMSSPTWQQRRLTMDISYGSLLQIIINSNSQKPDTEITLLLFALKNSPMPYSEWRYAQHEGTLYHNTQTWLRLATKEETHVCRLDEAQFFVQLHLMMHQLSYLSPNEVRCIVSVFQYKQWMAQFDEIQAFLYDDHEIQENVKYLQELLLCPERFVLDAIVHTLQRLHPFTRPNIEFSQTTVSFLNLFHSKLLLLLDAWLFDSSRSAADDLANGVLFAAF